jgi:UDP-N-acetylmuramate--alanine ligase
MLYTFAMNVHFIGIGGIGMSALARYFDAQGVTVTGSDASRNPTVRELESEGIEVFGSHSAEHITDSMYQVVYSEAVPPENPERRAAEQMGIRQKSYFAALGDISRTKTTISICGTHGKSTTTAMAGLALENAHLDPLVILGTKIFEWGKKNIRLPEHGEAMCQTEKGIFLVESCEYHNSFLHLEPSIIVVTNVEPDHLDFFGTAENYYCAFAEFGKKLNSGGTIIADFSNPKIEKIFAECTAQKVNTSSFLPLVPNMSIPGAHNRENAACVLALANTIGANTEEVSQALSRFHGTWRRFEKKGEKNGVHIFDDYAHHPTEIKATLSAFREKFPEQKIWAVFQPHQYSRTREFLLEFGESFANADEVLIPNIYRVRDTEEDVKAVSAEKLVAEIEKNGKKARHTHDFAQTIALLKNELKEGDVVVTIGAGPVYEVGESFLGE